MSRADIPNDPYARRESAGSGAGREQAADDRNKHGNGRMLPNRLRKALDEVSWIHRMVLVDRRCLSVRERRLVSGLEQLLANCTGIRDGWIKLHFDLLV